jgi:hypothetical protein
VKGTLHWVSISHAVPVEARLYDRLFKVENLADAEGDFKDHINPDSLQVLPAVYAEPALRRPKPKNGTSSCAKATLSSTPILPRKGWCSTAPWA